MDKEALILFSDEHLAYEVGTFSQLLLIRWILETGASIQDDSVAIPAEPTGPISRAVHHLTIEGLLLHARVLAEFLGEKKPHFKDDVVASDFAPDWTMSEEFSVAWFAVRQPINQRVAHLTAARVGLAAAPEPWDMGPFYALARELRRFREEAVAHGTLSDKASEIIAGLRMFRQGA